MSDLPLFQWKPPVQVLVFPHEKRVGRVRHVADKLQQKRGEAANAYWRQTVTALVKQMEKAGLPQSTIKREVRAFFDAVQDEMVRRSYRHRDPGGAA